MSDCPFVDAVKDDQWHRAKLVRVAKNMRASERWADAMQFERGQEPEVTVASGEINAK